MKCVFRVFKTRASEVRYVCSQPIAIGDGFGHGVLCSDNRFHADLSFRSNGNRTQKVWFGIGDGNDLSMTRIMRAQANFTEYAPIFLILLGYVEINGLHSALVNVFGLIFIVGRTMHAYSLLQYEEYAQNGKLTIYPKWRVRGMICTLTVIGLLSTVVLYQLARQLID